MRVREEGVHDRAMPVFLGVGADPENEREQADVQRSKYPESLFVQRARQGLGHGAARGGERAEECDYHRSRDQAVEGARRAELQPFGLERCPHAVLVSAVISRNTSSRLLTLGVSS